MCEMQVQVVTASRERLNVALPSQPWKAGPLLREVLKQLPAGSGGSTDDWVLRRGTLSEDLPQSYTPDEVSTTLCSCSMML